MLLHAAGIDIPAVYKEETPTSYCGFQAHLNLLQGDVNTVQKHQDLYLSADGGRASKAERIAAHQENLYKNSANKRLIMEAKFKHNQTDIRQKQLGTAPQQSSDIQESGSSDQSKSDAAGPEVFKFGQAPKLGHVSSVSAERQAAASVTYISGNEGKFLFRNFHN